MMDREWKAILRRYGQDVRVVTGASEQRGKAFLQNILENEDQLVPTPMGLRREEQVLLLGGPELELRARESVVFWQERAYEVISSREVGDGHHRWAILRVKEGVA